MFIRASFNEKPGLVRDVRAVFLIHSAIKTINAPAREHLLQYYKILLK